MEKKGREGTRALIGNVGHSWGSAGESRAVAGALAPADFQAARSDDSNARWSETANGNSHSCRSARAAPHPFSAHALWSSRKTTGAVASVLERTSPGRLYFRHPESARPLQVRRRVRSDFTSGLKQPQIHQRNDRRLRQHRVAGEKRPNNSGKVGMYGVSYDGLTTALALLHPHPALKAMSEQASPVDQWMNDDDHRYGALRESYDFEYAVMEQADKNSNTHFEFETYDTYQWYLDLGPLSNINAKYLHGKIPYWNSTIDHPDYDDFWKKEAWVRQLHASTVPNLNVAGFWDQEDPWGPWEIFRRAEEHDPDHTNFMVAVPWIHTQ